jgi:rRNA maturation endonuclease Nob1
MSAEDYRQEIAELGFDRMTIEVSSVTEAKQALAKVRAAQKELRQIKRNINMDMKIIRADYSERMATAGAGTSTLMGLFGQRRAAGQLRADAKRRLRAERDATLAPYDEVKLMIDDLLVQMDSAKLQLTGFIEDLKAEEQAKKPTTASFCPECGQRVAKTDKFCRACGCAL